MIQSSGKKYNRINFSKNHVSGTARKIGVTFIWWFTKKGVYHISWESFVYLLEGIVLRDRKVPMHYYIRWIYDFIVPGSGLTQYWFYDQGRRTQEAVEDYVKGITEKTYIHTDGAKMYEIYNAAGIIMRVACAVHVRRPFWKLKETSDDAARIVYLFDEVFRKERKWNDEEGQIAIYRNQSYFLGSVKSAKRFARLVSLTQSAKNCKRNVQKYFHDILNRIVVDVEDELVSMLPHKWVEPVTIPLVY